MGESLRYFLLSVSSFIYLFLQLNLISVCALFQLLNTETETEATTTKRLDVFCSLLLSTRHLFCYCVIVCDVCALTCEPAYQHTSPPVHPFVCCECVCASTATENSPHAIPLHESNGDGMSIDCNVVYIDRREVGRMPQNSNRNWKRCKIKITKKKNLLRSWHNRKNFVSIRRGWFEWQSVLRANGVDRWHYGARHVHHQFPNVKMRKTAANTHHTASDAKCERKSYRAKEEEVEWRERATHTTITVSKEIYPFLPPLAILTIVFVWVYCSRSLHISTYESQNEFPAHGLHQKSDIADAIDLIVC